MKRSTKLLSGVAYLVKMTGESRASRRIFKWKEKRVFPAGKGAPLMIPCFVFTTRVAASVCGSWDAAKKELSLTGRRVPSREVSIPFYDVISCQAA